MDLHLFTRTPKLDGTDTYAKRQELLHYFTSTFDRYESLFNTLNCDDAYYTKSIPLRHPLIFYFGHTATFFVNKLLLTKMIDQRIDPRFESMFAVGVDEMSWDDLDDTHYDWPSVAEVRQYRQKIRNLVTDLIQNAPLTLPITWEHPWWAIIMGIEHERIHLETSSVLIRQHKLDFVQTAQAWQASITTGQAPKNELVAIHAGEVNLGKAHDDIYYGWDNEYGHHHAHIDAFQASRYLVSNQEFLAFVEDNGYQNAEFWTEEGWNWRNYSQAKHPTFWLKKDNDWYLRLMTEEIPMPWDYPVEVNYLEAKAFCNWKAAQTGQPVRLPSEEEWQHLYNLSGLAFPQEGEIYPANLHLDHGANPCAVNRFAHGELFDVVGNVWQWTETPIYPFTGFKVHPIYDDFTMPTFDNQHNIIKGGSWISCGNESQHTSRYAFRRHFFQHAGFRYVVSEHAPEQHASYYETDKMLSEYAEFHYGQSYFNVANFSQTLAQLAIEHMGDRPTQTALDIGCSVGRATFELAKKFDHVTGIDFSARFIKQGVQLADEGVVRYAIAREGEILDYREIDFDDLNLAETRHKVQFLQGDACNLKTLFAGYDLIFAANLIDRLAKPKSFLEQIHQRLNIGGLLLIASPYTWLEEHTPRENWLGGFKQDGENFTTLDGLQAVLAPHFKLIHQQDVPFVIRETARKFQHSISAVTLWQRII